ncbi:MAG: sporulation protein YqfD [Clostridia bacterium]|nr:sporulation protein YqfD [Clostridia bacterium]
MRLMHFTQRFSITGLNLERFINLVQQSGIPLLSIRRTDARTLVCECFSSDLKTISALAVDKGWRIHDMQPLGHSARLVQIRKRPGIPIGFVLMIVGMLIMSQFVWRIDIQNAGPYQADISTYLSDNGFQCGMRRSSIDAAALENELLRRYPKIAWFQVYVSHMTLVVEATHGVPMPDLTDTTPGDVHASQDGIVESILVYAGTAAVKPGETVRKGDVLIRGQERSSDGEWVSVHAQGVINARTWHSETVHMPLYELQSAETGREQAVYSLHTPWFTLPPAPEKPAYLASNLYLTDTPLGGVFFPLFSRTAVYREVSLSYVPRDVQKVRKEAEDAAFKRLKTALFDDEIIDKWVDYCMIEDDILAVTVTAERLVDIGVFSSP